MATETQVPVKSGSRALRPLFDWGGGGVWEPFSRLRDQVDRLFEDFTGRQPSVPALRTSFEMLAPAIDVKEQDDQFKLTAELPGIDPKDIDVRVSDRVLRISGEKKEEREEKEKGYAYSERSYGSFHRSMTLPTSVDPERINASYDKDVLTLVLPKSDKAKESERKIDIKSA